MYSFIPLKHTHSLQSGTEATVAPCFSHNFLFAKLTCAPFAFRWLVQTWVSILAILPGNYAPEVGILPNSWFMMCIKKIFKIPAQWCYLLQYLCPYPDASLYLTLYSFPQFVELNALFHDLNWSSVCLLHSNWDFVLHKSTVHFSQSKHGLGLFAYFSNSSNFCIGLVLSHPGVGFVQDPRKVFYLSGTQKTVIRKFWENPQWVLCQKYLCSRAASTDTAIQTTTHLEYS